MYIKKKLHENFRKIFFFTLFFALSNFSGFERNNNVEKICSQIKDSRERRSITNQNANYWASILIKSIKKKSLHEELIFWTFPLFPWVLKS